MFFFRTILLLGMLLAFPQPKTRCADFIGEISSSRVIESDSGVVNLEWGSSDGEAEALFEVERSIGVDFSETDLIYEGSDRSTYLTGLREGDYFFRVRESGDDTWSAPVRVTVKFIGRGKLFVLLGVGFVVCIFTVAAILQGHMGRRVV